MSGCFCWAGYVDRDGYGRIKVKGENILAHRVAWELFNGAIPEGEQVLHACDNPSCSRPDHLFLGDAAVNMADRNAKDRQAKGERNGRAKLTERQVREIRASAEGIRPLARKYGLDPKSVRDIRSGRNWGWLK